MRDWTRRFWERWRPWWDRVDRMAGILTTAKFIGGVVLWGAIALIALVIAIYWFFSRDSAWFLIGVVGTPLVIWGQVALNDRKRRGADRQEAGPLPTTHAEQVRKRHAETGTTPLVSEVLDALERDAAAPKLIECQPDSRWGYVHYQVESGAPRPEPAVFGGLLITNRTQQASRFKARVKYADGTDDHNWPSPWELTGAQFEELAPNESATLLLFSVEDREGDERKCFTPFSIGKTRDGYYKFHNRFLSDKPIRVVVDIWDDHGHQWEVEIRIGISGAGTPIKEVIKDCWRVR